MFNSTTLNCKDWEQWYSDTRVLVVFFSKDKIIGKQNGSNFNKTIVWNFWMNDSLLE